MAKLEEMGEFVRSASSTIEAPVVRRLKEAFNGGSKGGSAGRDQGRRDQGGFSDRPRGDRPARLPDAGGSTGVSAPAPSAPASSPVPGPKPGPRPGPRPVP